MLNTVNLFTRSKTLPFHMENNTGRLLS